MGISIKHVAAAALTVALTTGLAAPAVATPVRATSAPVAAPAAAHAASSSAVTEEQWLDDVSAAVAPARAYVEQRVADSSDPNPAIVFDIDNTTVATHFHPFTEPGIAPVVELAQYAHEHGVAIIFITARPRAIDPVTRHTLEEAGYTVDELYSRGLSDLFKPIQDFKTNARIAVENQGYTIIANIGNNWTDLDGGHAERTFKLPDYNGLLP
ncbi:HAD family acid phosphatase [Kitasatospora sp. NPDC048296]|uniref:HAD family acid phosphatase n=1 Tax=Kitasatospora sp. NPDC048296 TaxID=3364048 RepID=UPI003720EB9C